MTPRLAFALDAAYRAGRRTLAYFYAGAEVLEKEDETPVTAADKEAEAYLRSRIREQYPSEAILGEEEGATGSGASRWVIDPIDGTKSFVAGVPLYATLLSFEVDGEPEIGICYLPALDEMIFAEKGGGAYWNGRPCRVSSTSHLKGSIICCGGHRSMARYGRMNGFLKLAESAMATRTWSDAYGHALVATGRADLMIDPIVHHWDLSAVSLIVREAGGTFTQFDGNPSIGAEAVSSNGLLHTAALEAFRT
ncbi:MAG TPA: inositol monophosphatase family protein [Fimbriimonadaceae bacterium]|nr:inositol monophosphatase family protein [Fimbriimonadaceae bacterium]